MSSPVTVVIPTYRAAQYLPETLQSVFAQTHLPAEVIVVDDKSPDDTVSVAREFSRSAPFPVRVIESRRNSGGPTTPLNIGIGLAQTKYIAVLEQDDLMTPGRLEHHLAAMERFPDCEFSFGRYEIIGDAVPEGGRSFYDPSKLLDRLRVAETHQQDSYIRIPSATFRTVALWQNVAISNSSFFFTKELARRIGGFSTAAHCMTDWLFLIAASEATSLAFVNSVCLRYRFQLSSLSRNRLNGTQAIREQLAVGYYQLKYPEEYGPEAWQGLYWSYRRNAATAMKRGQLRLALRIYSMLYRSGALSRHLQRRPVMAAS